MRPIRVIDVPGHATSDGVRAIRAKASLALILVVSFMVVLDFSIVNVALASIERELHTGATAVQWVITAYAITFGGLLILGGRIADLFGRRRMFIAGLVIFSLASLGGGLAGNIVELVIARAVQGVGAAIVAPAALSLITTSTPEGSARTRALGFYSATATIGFVAGLVLGGILVQFLDWRAVLWVNVPIGLAAALLAPVLLPVAASPASRIRLDLGGAFLITVGVGALVYGISEGPVTGWMTTRTIGTLTLSIALLGTFLKVERHHPAPLLRLGILRRRALRNANLATILLGAWSAGEVLVIPLYLQLALHYSPIAVGFAMAPQGVSGFLGASQGARFVRKIGATRLLVVSATSAAVGLSLLGLFLTAHSYPLLIIGFVLAGYGTATSSLATMIVATKGVDKDEQGLAGGLVNMSRQVGAAIGVAVGAAIIGGQSAGATAISADRAAVLTSAGIALLAAAVAVWSAEAFSGANTVIASSSSTGARDDMGEAGVSNRKLPLGAEIHQPGAGHREPACEGCS